MLLGNRHGVGNEVDGQEQTTIGKRTVAKSLAKKLLKKEKNEIRGRLPSDNHRPPTTLEHHLIPETTVRT